MLTWPPFWAVSAPPVAALTKVLVIDLDEELKIGRTTDACFREMFTMIYTQYAIRFSYLRNINSPIAQKMAPKAVAQIQLSRVGYCPIKGNLAT